MSTLALQPVLHVSYTCAARVTSVKKKEQNTRGLIRTNETGQTAETAEGGRRLFSEKVKSAVCSRDMHVTLYM